MLNQILFYIVILLTNIIHGITGFAGTILAMPPSLMLVGYDIAKPILNVLAIFSGVYVFVGNYKKIDWKELAKIVVVMALGIFGAVFIKGLFVGKEHLLYKLLGLLVIVLFYRSAKEHNDSAFRWMWLTIVLSFGFYIPVVLWANAIPMIGMLMIPKTCAYVWTVLIGYSAMKKECK